MHVSVNESNFDFVKFRKQIFIFTAVLLSNYQADLNKNETGRSVTFKGHDHLNKTR